jgi:hypothetical protein
MRSAAPRDAMSDLNYGVAIGRHKFDVLESVSGGSGSLSNETRGNFWQSRAGEQNATSR